MKDRLPHLTAAPPDRKRETLEYIVEIVWQLAEMAEDIEEAALAQRLRKAVESSAVPTH